MVLIGCSEEDSVIQYSLSVKSSPSEGGSTSIVSEKYKEGKIVSLFATSSNEYIFKNWSGSVSGFENPIAVTMNTNKTITAVFEKKKYQLVISIEGKGIVNEDTTSSMPLTDYPYGAVIKISAIPDEGWEFESWSGDIVENESEIQITMDKSIRIYAKFKATRTYVPDDAFEEILIFYGLDDVMDDYVTTSNINKETVLNINGGSNIYGDIKDLTGLQDFVNLKQLEITNNNLASFDASIVPNLEVLNLSYNKLEEVNLSKSLSLKEFKAFNNNLINLDISNNPNLEILFVNDNLISLIDFSTNLNLSQITIYNNLLTEIDVSNNTKLRFFDSHNNQIGSIDVTNNSDLSHLNIDFNDLSNIDISNNTKLGTLSVGNNNLTSINVLENISLHYLELSNNKISDLDISMLANLSNFYASENQLSSLNVSMNYNIINLDVGYNDLIFLDISNNLNLENLNIENNQLTNSFDVSNNAKLKYFNITNNSLECIKVSEEQNGSNFWQANWQKDQSTIYSLDCN